MLGSSMFGRCLGTTLCLEIISSHVYVWSCMVMCSTEFPMCTRGCGCCDLLAALSFRSAWHTTVPDVQSECSHSMCRHPAGICPHCGHPDPPEHSHVVDSAINQSLDPPPLCRAGAKTLRRSKHYSRRMQVENCGALPARFLPISISW